MTQLLEQSSLPSAGVRVFWPFKRFKDVSIGQEEKAKAMGNPYIERLETIWINPSFPQEETSGLSVQVRAYWPTRAHWGGWPTNWHLGSWILWFWNEYDDWKDPEVQWAHGVRILGWELEF